MDGSSDALIEAHGLSKNYGTTQAVRDVSFRVSRGEVVGFLGPNGAGKTTTMKILTGFLRPTAGHAVLGGVDVAEDPLAAQAQLGYLPEGAPLYDEMMVVDFLRYVAELRGVAPGDRASRMRTVSERCGIVDVLGKDIVQLSKGYRQRVALAQAMLHDPDLLILDEPTSGLDPNQIIEIRQLIKDLGREKTIILSTHILPEVQATCNRILIINDGQLVADDSPEALTGQGAGAVIKLELKPASDSVTGDQVRSLLAEQPGVRAVDLLATEGDGVLRFSIRGKGSVDPREALFAAAVANQWTLLEMHRERGSLEDTFRRLTRGEAS